MREEVTMYLDAPAEITEEEQLVAELELLGVRYLSRQTNYQATQVRPPAVLIADLIKQPDARVRCALIAVLLSRPDLATAVPAALPCLTTTERVTLKCFYTAAVLLQRQYAERLRPFMMKNWQWLPDLFSQELGLGENDSWPGKLAHLGEEHQRRTRTTVNWTGTYENVTRRLLHQWELVGSPSSGYSAIGRPV